MLELPQTTAFDTVIPKKKFYENLSVSSKLKRSFIDQITEIRWAHKISPATMNLEEGKTVTEIEVFRVRLTGEELDEAVLQQIDREIPYHILYLLEAGERVQAWIGYKEATEGGKSAFAVRRYFHTDWMKESDLPLHIEGQGMDAVYDNLIRQIADAMAEDNGEPVKSTIGIESRDSTIKEAIDADERRAKIEKQIATLERKIRNEKQLNRQVELRGELRKLERELE